MNRIVTFRSMTATPFSCNRTYQEFLPCPALSPYIHCFWGSVEPYVMEVSEHAETSDLVVPDLCADIIYDIDYSTNTISGNFCAVNDESFCSGSSFAGGHEVSMFGIRFFAWSVYKFAEDSLLGTVNGYYDVRAHFAWLDKLLRPRLFELTTLKSKIDFVQKILCERLERIRVHENLDCCINDILMRNGCIEITELAQNSTMSVRQLERIFSEYAALSPKKFCSIVRYQNLWKDILSDKKFNVLDAVDKYGYADQPHLLHEFKHYHTMNIKEALQLAKHDVAFLQERKNLV